MPALSKLTLTRATSFIQVASAGMFAIYEVTHMSERGLSGSVIGVLLAIQSALTIASSPLWGWVSDKFRCYRQLVSLSSLGLAFSLFWLSQATTLSDFVFYVCIRGLLFTAMTSTMTALAMANLSSRSPGREFSAYRIFGSIGFMIVSFTLPIFFSEIEHILIAGACLLPCSVFFILQLENPTPRDKQESDPKKPAIPQAVWFFLAAQFVVSITLPGNIGFLNDYIRELGGSTKLMGWYSALMGLMALIALPLMGKLVDTRGPYGALVIGFISQALRPFIVSSISDPNWLWVSHFCHIFGWAGREVGALVLMLSLMGSNRRATAVSLLATMTMAGTMVGSYLMGTWADRFGYPSMFRYISITAFVGLPLLILSIKSHNVRSVENQAS